MADPDLPRTIAIIGTGASGTLLATQLLRRARGPLRLLLIERTGYVVTQVNLKDGKCERYARQVYGVWS